MTTLIELFKNQLATLFDKLKMGSPIAYLIVMVIIFGGAAVVEHATELADQFPWLFNTVVDEILKALVAILISPRTKRHMSKADDSAEGLSVLDIDHDD